MSDLWLMIFIKQWLDWIQLLSITQVNKDFGSIFSKLLPGTTAKLEPPQGQDVLDGLEVKVGGISIWNEIDLTILSAGCFWWKVERFAERAFWRAALSGDKAILRDIWNEIIVQFYVAELSWIRFQIFNDDFSFFKVALSLILSLLLFKPAPLYILDEVMFRIHGLWWKVMLTLPGRALKTCVHFLWIAFDFSCFRLTLPLTFPTLKILGRCWKTISRYFYNQNIFSNSRFFSAQHSQFIVVSLKDGMFNNANVLFRYFINTNSSFLIFVTPHADLHVIKDQVCWWDVNSEQDGAGSKQEEEVKILPWHRCFDFMNTLFG